MYIHRIIIRNFRNFDNLDITLFDDDLQRPLDSVLLIGPNGSGKTTLLRVISELWDDFGAWLHSGSSPNESSKNVDSSMKIRNSQFFRNADLVAMEIRHFDLPPSRQQPLALFDVNDKPSSIWIYVALDKIHRQELTSLVNNSNAIFVGMTSEDNSPEYSNREYLRELTKQKRELEIGMENRDLLPNMVFLEAGTRNIRYLPRTVRREREFSPDPIYRWSVKYKPDILERYRPDVERYNLSINEQNIETILGNIKLRNPDQFNQILENIKQFFGGAKEIVDFDDAIRLRVLINKNKKFHPLSELSAGEQQCVIMFVMVSRGLMPGGIVLIDEPDLHLHESLQRHFIHELERLIHERNGQLIIASHSREMREEFYDSKRIDLGQLETV